MPERGGLISGATGVVGDDHIVFVHQPIQFGDDSVGVDGRIVTGELGQPLVMPLRANGSDFLRLSRALFRRRLGIAFHFGAKRLQREFGVANQAVLHRHVFVQIHGV